MNLTQVNHICNNSCTVMSYEVKCKLEYVLALRELWQSSAFMTFFFFILFPICGWDYIWRKPHYAFSPHYQDEVLVWLPHSDRKSLCTFLQSSGARRMLDFAYWTPRINPHCTILQGLLQREPTDAAPTWKHTNSKIQEDGEKSCVHVSRTNCCLGDQLALVRGRQSQIIVSMICLMLLLASFKRKVVFHLAESRGDKSLPILVLCL